MAVRELVGVRDDGARGPKVPVTTRVPLRMTQGSTLLVQMTMVHASGAPILLADDVASAGYLTVKDLPSIEAAPLLSVTGVLVPTAGPNRIDFSVSPDATKFLSPGRYHYDVWLVWQGSRDAVIPMSAFLLEPGLRLP